MIGEIVTSPSVELVLLGVGIGGGITGKILVDRIRNGNNGNGHKNKPLRCTTFCSEHHELSSSVANVRADVKVVKNDIQWICSAMGRGKKDGN